MRSLKDVEDAIAKAKAHTNERANQNVLENLLDRFARTHRNQPADLRPERWRMTMKSPITKLSIAAAIIVAVVLGLFEFIDTGSTSGVVWAEVAQKVEASPGVIFRIRETGKGDPNEQWPNGHRVIQRNATLSRLDWCRGDQIHRTVYFDLAGETEIWVAHDIGVYSKRALSDEKVQKMRAGGLGWADPQGLLNLGLSLEQRALGQKTIEGVLCEGIEATGPDGSTGRVWVSVETGYPVLLEIEGTGEDDGSLHHTTTMDQFQWNADLSPESVEPEIPADYRPLE